MQIITDRFQKEMKEHGNYYFPFLISQERLSRYESGAFLWHWHPEIELTLITKGEMIYQVNHQTFHLHQGEALFGNTGALHAGSGFQNRDCAYISITFDPKLIYRYENSVIYTRYIQPILQNFSLSAVHFDLSEEWHGEVLAILKEMTEIEAAAYPTYEIDILIRLERFWQLLFLHNDCPPSIAKCDKRNYDRIRMILSFIEENYASPFTLEAVAEQIHLCKEECCRIFKRYMKVSLFEFLLQYRIEKSLDLLMNTDCSITEISEQAGFHDSNYYSKIFRRQKGCSPSRYRKTYQKNL